MAIVEKNKIIDNKRLPPEPEANRSFFMVLAVFLILVSLGVVASFLGQSNVTTQAGPLPILH